MKNLRDIIWKGIVEDLFADFLHFFFKEQADKIFDFKRGFEFLDKELEQLFPIRKMEAPKFVDKLVKVFTLDGREEWVLIHVEVQGYSDPDFASRLFTYFYRILDRYNKPVSTIAIFTDKLPPQSTIDHYHYNFLGTECRYKFNTYQVGQQPDAELEASNNPFAVAIHTALIAQEKKKLGDEGLYPLKFALVKNLLQKNFSREKIEALLSFIQFYLEFENPEIRSKFEKEVDSLTEKSEVMGVKELVLEAVKQEGREEGRAKGKDEKSMEVVRNLLSANKFTLSEIANFANVPEAFVRKVKASMTQKQ